MLAPINPLTIFGNFTGSNPKAAYKDGTFWQTFNSGGTTEYSSIGPYKNEVFTTYQYGGGAHHIRFLAYASPDILLVHQSTVSGFYRVLKSNRILEPMHRSVKDLLLKDTNMRITSSTTSKALPSGTALLASSSSTTSTY